MNNSTVNPEYNHLRLWEQPAYYFGSEWSAYYVGLGQNRDSDCLTRANFDEFLERLGGESDTVRVVREGHFLCGWVEWVAIHQDDREACQKADTMLSELEDYPVLDDERFSQYEDDEAQEIWRNCYDNRERVEYIREHRSQFDFGSIEELMSVVRGKYFNGYACELIG